MTVVTIGGGAVVPGSFFEFKSADGDTNDNTTTKIANTKNNIIRLIFDSSAEGAQCSAKDNDNDEQKPSYIRQRNWNNGTACYVNYADCPNVNHYDFELSDAITVFENGSPICSADGVKTGMLSTLLQNGMAVGGNKVRVTQVQIRKSMVSKYVSGYALYTGHHLSSTDWRAVALPYNLDANQIKETFGEGARICELGQSKVEKASTQEGSYHYSISLNFEKISADAGMNANYPYLIKLSANNVNSDDVYTIANVKADVRDFQSYEFRTARFNVDALNAKEPVEGDADYNKKKQVFDFEQNIKSKLTDEVRMVFKSTAPVFNITNKDVGDVEIINGVANDGRTILNVPSDNSNATNYYLYDNTLIPVVDKAVRLKSGLAYVVFPSATKNLFDTNADGTESQAAKCSFVFDGEGTTTGIDEINIAQKAMSTIMDVYTLGGQLIRKGENMEGLPKGIYVVAGKKVVVK